MAPRCEVCGLDLGFADAGDGPAVFVTLIAGFLVLGIALAVEIAYEPPLWVYVVVFLPLTLVVCLGLLRPLKGFLIAAQYINKAAPGRLEEPMNARVRSLVAPASRRSSASRCSSASASGNCSASPGRTR